MRPGVLILACLLSAASAAGAMPYSRFHMSSADMDRLTSFEYPRCRAALDDTTDVTHPLLACIDAEQARLDTLLNRVYRDRMARQPNRVARLRLRNLERRWLVTRYTYCHHHFGYPGEYDWVGQIMFNSCAVGEMRNRIAWLEGYGRRR